MYDEARASSSSSSSLADSSAYDNEERIRGVSIDQVITPSGLSLRERIRRYIDKSVESSGFNSLGELVVQYARYRNGDKRHHGKLKYGPASELFQFFFIDPQNNPDYVGEYMHPEPAPLIPTFTSFFRHPNSSDLGDIESDLWIQVRNFRKLGDQDGFRTRMDAFISAVLTISQGQPGKNLATYITNVKPRLLENRAEGTLLSTSEPTRRKYESRRYQVGEMFEISTLLANTTEGWLHFLDQLVAFQASVEMTMAHNALRFLMFHAEDVHSALVRAHGQNPIAYNIIANLVTVCAKHPESWMTRIISECGRTITNPVFIIHEDLVGTVSTNAPPGMTVVTVPSLTSGDSPDEICESGRSPLIQPVRFGMYDLVPVNADFSMCPMRIQNYGNADSHTTVTFDSLLKNMGIWDSSNPQSWNTTASFSPDKAARIRTGDTTLLHMIDGLPGGVRVPVGFAYIASLYWTATKSKCPWNSSFGPSVYEFFNAVGSGKSVWTYFDAMNTANFAALMQKANVGRKTLVRNGIVGAPLSRPISVSPGQLVVRQQRVEEFGNFTSATFTSIADMIRNVTGIRSADSPFQRNPVPGDADGDRAKLWGLVLQIMRVRGGANNGMDAGSAVAGAYAALMAGGVPAETQNNFRDFALSRVADEDEALIPVGDQFKVNWQIAARLLWSVAGELVQFHEFTKQIQNRYWEADAGSEELAKWVETVGRLGNMNVDNPGTRARIVRFDMTSFELTGAHINKNTWFGMIIDGTLANSPRRRDYIMLEGLDSMTDDHEQWLINLFILLATVTYRNLIVGEETVMDQMIKHSAQNLALWTVDAIQQSVENDLQRMNMALPKNHDIYRNAFMKNASDIHQHTFAHSSSMCTALIIRPSMVANSYSTLVVERNAVDVVHTGTLMHRGVSLERQSRRVAGINEAALSVSKTPIAHVPMTGIQPGSIVNGDYEPINGSNHDSVEAVKRGDLLQKGTAIIVPFPHNMPIPRTFNVWNTDVPTVSIALHHYNFPKTEDFAVNSPLNNNAWASTVLLHSSSMFVFAQSALLASRAAGFELRHPYDGAASQLGIKRGALPGDKLGGPLYSSSITG